MDERAFDLGTLAARLTKNKRTRESGKRILAYLDVASSHVDLLLARELCHVINESLIVDEHRLAVNAGLINQIVLLYARAMMPSVKKNGQFSESERRAFSYTSKMSDTEKRRHEEINRIRDGAVAHFNRDTRFRDVLWAREALIYLPPRSADDDGRIMSISQRIGLDSDIFALVAEQIECGIRILDEALPKRNQDAWDAFIAVSRDREILEELAKLQVDLRTFFETEERLADFLGPALGAAQINRSLISEEE